LSITLSSWETASCGDRGASGPPISPSHNNTMKFALIVVTFCVFIGICLGAVGDTFTVNCAPLTIQRADPIVNPGIAGSHVHSVVGANAFRRNMAGYKTGEANATTCNKAKDHSNYWVPQLYHQRSDGKWEMVKWGGSAIYYQKRACDYSPNARYCNKSFVPLAFPEGFRMVAGDPARRTQDDKDFAQKAISIMCIDGNGGEHPGFPTVKCGTFRSQVYFPSCWDGVNIDTPDHKSHVAYPAIGDYNGGVCPQSHPKAIFSLFFEFWYEVGAYNDLNRFAFANGDPTGYGFHGDFIMGWTDRDALQHAHETCITASDCPTLGNQPTNPQPLLYPAIFEEDIGLKGPIDKLPGNNPVVFPK